MEEVKFDEQNQYTPTFRRSPVQKGLVGYLIRKGLAKNVTQANLILIAIMVICLGITFFMIKQMNTSPLPDNDYIDPALIDQSQEPV